MNQMLDGYPPHLKKGEPDALFTLSSGKSMGREEWIPFAQDIIQQMGLEGEEYDGISPRKRGSKRATNGRHTKRHHQSDGEMG